MSKLIRVLVGVEGGWVAQINSQRHEIRAREHVPGVEGLLELGMQAQESRWMG